MAARSASKATSKKRTAAVRPKAGATKTREAKAKSRRSGPQTRQKEDPRAKLAQLEAERNRLAFELDTAQERIRLLEEREATIIKRIDAIAQSLHKLLIE
jgi:hypothetical protein